MLGNEVCNGYFSWYGGVNEKHQVIWTSSKIIIISVNEGVTCFKKTFDSTLSRAKIYLPILRSAEAQDQWEKIIVQEILDFHGLIALTFMMKGFDSDIQ